MTQNIITYLSIYNFNAEVGRRYLPEAGVHLYV